MGCWLARWQDTFEIRDKCGLNFLSSATELIRYSDFRSKSPVIIPILNFGFLFRRQICRDFLFLELEPTINFRKVDASANREQLWRFIARLEIALKKDLLRAK